ncbi:Wdr35 [Symbiodinium sp. KB8]|nr:Wdr35 [Symbiodinium sp. KB8]
MLAAVSSHMRNAAAACAEICAARMRLLQTALSRSLDEARRQQVFAQPPLSTSLASSQDTKRATLVRQIRAKLDSQGDTPASFLRARSVAASQGLLSRDEFVACIASLNLGVSHTDVLELFAFAVGSNERDTAVLEEITQALEMSSPAPAMANGCSHHGCANGYSSSPLSPEAERVVGRVRSAVGRSNRPFEEVFRGFCKSGGRGATIMSRADLARVLSTFEPDIDPEVVARLWRITVPDGAPGLDFGNFCTWFCPGGRALPGLTSFASNMGESQMLSQLLEKSSGLSRTPSGGLLSPMSASLPNLQLEGLPLSPGARLANTLAPEQLSDWRQGGPRSAWPTWPALEAAHVQPPLSARLSLLSPEDFPAIACLGRLQTYIVSKGLTVNSAFVLYDTHMEQAVSQEGFLSAVDHHGFPLSRSEAEMLFSRLARRTRPNQPPSLSFEEPSEGSAALEPIAANLLGFSRQTYSNATKVAINSWLAELVRGSRASSADSIWSLLLETHELQTLSALRAAGVHAANDSTIVPNPSGEESAAIRQAAPGICAVPCTSHELLAAWLTTGNDVAPELKAFRSRCPGFDFVWLDYCGTLGSSPGRRRQADLRSLFTGSLLRPRCVLAVTVSERGAARLYRGELADGLVLCVRAAAREVQQQVALLGIAEYKAPTPMVLAAFVVDAEAAALAACKPVAEGLSFVPGDHWCVGRGLAAGLETPLARALRFAAGAFATAAGRGASALALESVKLLPVTQALEACGCTVLSSLPDQLEAEVAAAIHGRAIGVLSGAALLDYLQQLARRPQEIFAAAWLGYDGGRACTSTQLHSCSDWAHLNELLGLRLLSTDALLAVTVAYVSTAEVWLGSAVDWTLAGLRDACSRHGYHIAAASVMKFTANNSRLAVFLRLGQGPRKLEAGVLPPALLNQPGFEEAAGASMEFHSSWDEARVKTPSAEGRRLRQLLPALRQLLAGGAADETSDVILIHEPGFVTLLPKLAALDARLICCVCDDPVVLNDLQRRQHEAVECSAVADGMLQGTSVLALLEDCGPIAWRKRWQDLAVRWLRMHAGDGEKRLVLLLEASQLQLAVELIGELRLAAGDCTVLLGFSFVQGSRRWVFAALALAQVPAPARVPLPQGQNLQPLHLDDLGGVVEKSSMHNLVKLQFSAFLSQMSTKLCSTSGSFVDLRALQPPQEAGPCAWSVPGTELETVVYLSKKIAIPHQLALQVVSWNSAQGWIACGGESGLLKVLKLESASDGAAKAAAGQSNLSMNQTLEGHQGTIMVITWNENFRKLTTSDQNGLIIVWMLHRGIWFEEMINNRNRSVVRDMKWSADCQKICIIYEDGAVIVGTVDGQRLWGKEVKTQLAFVEWSPDGKNILFCTLNGEVHVYDNEGIYSHKVPIYCLDSGTEGTVAIAGIDWFAGPNGPENQTPTLCLGFENGRVQIMRSDADDKPVLLDTQLRCTGLKWDPNGSVVAIAGVQNQGAAAADREVGIVQFYAPSGQHLRSLLLACTEQESSWAESALDLLGGLGHSAQKETSAGSGLRLALAVDSHIFFANIRPDYLWGYFSRTLVYAVLRKERNEHVVVFWDTHSDEKYTKYIKHVTHIRSSEEYCVLVTKADDASGQHIVIVCNDIGSPVDSKYMQLDPVHVAMTNSHVIVTSEDVVYIWSYRTSVSRQAQGDLASAAGMGIKQKRAEMMFHIDESFAPGSGTHDKESFVPPSMTTQDPIACICATEQCLLVARESGVVHRYALPHLSLEARFTIRCRPQVIAANCDSTRMSVIDINGVLLLFDVEIVNHGFFSQQAETNSQTFSFRKMEGADGSNLLGFTEAAPPPMAEAPVDPMPHVGGAEAAPMDMMGSAPAPAAPYQDPFQGVPVKDPVGATPLIPEMNALREWEEKHEKDLEEMARKEAQEKEQRRGNATAELQKWNEERVATRKTRMASNRSNEETSEKAREEALKPGANPWERVCELIDTNAKAAEDSRDTSRLRSLLIQLKTNPDNGPGKQLDFERKDVWNMRWATDNPDLFAIMEKTRMYIVRGLQPEEPVLSNAYICAFKDLQIQSVLIDEVIQNPENPRKEVLLDFETKSLRDTRDILTKVSNLKDAFNYVDANPHPRLWSWIKFGGGERRAPGHAETLSGSEARPRWQAQRGMSSPMEDVIEGAGEEQRITVRVQTSPENTIEIAVSSKSTVFHLAAQVSQALPFPGSLPILSFQENELETDAVINELGITDGSLLTAVIKQRPVGIIEPGLGLMDNGGRVGAESAAMSCVDSLAIDADPAEAPALSPRSTSSECRLTAALREAIKQLVSAKGPPQQVEDLMTIAEDVERIEQENAELKRQMAMIQNGLHEQRRLENQLSRNTSQLMRHAGLSDGDADMWPAHQPMAGGYPGHADENIQANATIALLQHMQMLRERQVQAAQEEEENKSFLMKKGDAELSEIHRQAQLPRTEAGSVTGSGVLSSGHMTKEEMDRARRAHAEQLQSEHGKKQRELQEAEQKARSRDALFERGPFTGPAKMIGKH